VSTGVFRQYPTPRIPAPNFTPGQPLGSPSGAPAVPSWTRDVAATRLIATGIAPLLVVAASGYVPPAQVAIPARAASSLPQVLPEMLAPFLVQQQPAAPPILSFARAPYPVQTPALGTAALIPDPVVSAYVGPQPLAAVARAPAAAPQTQLEQIAPFLTQNTPDAPLSTSFVSVSRAAPPITYLLAPGLAPLVPAQAAQYVPPAALPRTSREVRHVPNIAARISAGVATSSPPQWSVPHPARSPYHLQHLRVWLVQGAAAPVVVLPVSGQTPALSGSGLPTVSGSGAATVNGPGAATVNASTDAMVNGVGDATVFG
jgi:hypothetical protein